MRRRVFLLLPFARSIAVAAARDARQEVLDLLASMASSLSAGDAAGFLKAFDSAMPGYGTLRANAVALSQQAEVASSIELLKDEGDDQQRTLELDWFLQLNDVRRREVVKCRVERKKKWLVVALQPLEFFAPPK